jgi:hypothetical protein
VPKTGNKTSNKVATTRNNWQHAVRANKWIGLIGRIRQIDYAAGPTPAVYEN